MPLLLPDNQSIFIHVSIHLFLILLQFALEITAFLLAHHDNKDELLSTPLLSMQNVNKLRPSPSSTLALPQCLLTIKPAVMET